MLVLYFSFRVVWGFFLMDEATGSAQLSSIWGKSNTNTGRMNPFCLNMISTDLNLKETQQTMQETYCQWFQGCPHSVGPVGPRFWIHSGGEEKRNASAVSVLAADRDG